MSKKIDNSLPEWAKAQPGDDDSFNLDFGHPDAPKLMPQRYVSNEQVDLEAMQLFDVIHGNKVIGLVDRRGGNAGRQPIKEETFEEDQAQIQMDNVQNKKFVSQLKKKNEVEIGEFVLMVKGKAICSGNINLILQTVLRILEADDLSDDDIILFERKPLSVLTDLVTSST